MTSKTSPTISGSNALVGSSNSSTSSRTADIYFEQDESGNRDYARVTQSGHTPVAYYDYIFWTSASGGTTISGSFEQSGSYIQPGIYSYRETIIDGTVVSRDPVSFSYTDIPSWITGDAVSTGYNPPNAPTYYAKMTASENTSVDARSYDVVITQSGSDKEITISVSQPGKANDTYVFTISPSTYDTTYSGVTFIPRTTSTKNGSNIGYSLTSGGTDWVVVDISGKISIEVLKNTSTSSRSATLVFTQNESGLKCYVYINQSGYTPTYTFTVIPTNLGVTAAETNETLTVESYKTVLESDGSETTESLDYEFSSNRDWVNAARTTTNTTYITVAENLTTIQRSAKITLTQAESGAQAFTNVIQAGKVQSKNKLTITSITYDDAYLFPPGITPVVGSTMYLKFLIPNTFTWETSSGLAMNRGTAYAGDTCNIYVFENSRYRLVRSFTLQTGEQTIAI